MEAQTKSINFRFHDLESCFEGYYIVPDYQREYVWEEKEVTQLLQDIHDEYEYDRNKEYFIGSTVVLKNKDGVYELIDGQQRTTTLFLLICSFRRIYKEKNGDIEIFENLLRKKTIDGSGNSVNRYKLQLQYLDSSEIISQIVNEQDKPKKLQGSSERIYSAYEDIYEFLVQKFKGDFEELKKFFVYCYRKVKFIQIETSDLNDALKIFETINERGVGLNSMDLLKNLIFRQAGVDKFNKIKVEWEKLVRTLERNKEKPLRFLRYFIMANYKVDSTKGDEIVREDEIYGWFTTSKNEPKWNTHGDPFKFTSLLQTNAQNYINYFRGTDDGGRNFALENIKKLGGGAFRQHLILLLAGQNLQKDLFDHLARQIETLIFYYIVTRENTRNFERNFSQWAKIVSKIQTKDDLNDFITTKLMDEIRSRKSFFKASFLEMNFNSLQYYRLKYVLAKIALYVEQERKGVKGYRSLEDFMDIGFEVEHIMPSTPEADLRSKIGNDYDLFKNKLGNLTLLEKSINGSVGNSDFYTVKKPEYEKSLIYLTKSISSLENVGVNTGVNRINSRLLSFNNWDSDAIKQRQNMLFDLAEDVWKIEIL